MSAKVLVPVLILALGIVSFVGLKATKPSVPQRPLQEKVWPVKVIAADVGTYQPHLTLYGRTVAGRRVELRALVSGEVIETGPEMREGAIVKRGAVLLRLDPFEYEGALDEAEAKLVEARAKVREIDAGIENERDALNHARTQLEIAQRDLERAVPLAQRGTVSQKTADDRRMAVSEREQGLEQRLNNLEIQQAKAAQQRAVIKQLEWKVRQARRNLEDTVLEAPFDAYVTNVTAEKGRIVGANDQVATLIDTNWMDVRFTLSDRQYGRIISSEKTLIDRPVEVLWHVGDQPIKYAARIERVGAEIAAEKGGVEIYARLDDPNSPTPIRPGAFVEIHLPDRVYQKVSRLPPTALYGNERIFVIEDGRLKARDVELVGAAEDQILVRGELGKGEKVIITRLSEAKDGLRVEER
ncbi:MAG: efflux RND transporter periplasmic adaptor subunit [Hyphomicrobiaceae bacterium]|nr:efflux RND transporter periplasmic adaptor subunit [Hyphomicrobiaceae bacterium]